uniref:zinc finger MYM-type protein 1-like n=1 Tax=Erigeron canadensis TaxID=72917 RepID=UPI001CB8A40E|nr:zinc finger MYM-type protein 1-like [Erigeron canadensis]
MANNNEATPISTPKMPKLVDLDNLPWDPIDRIRGGDSFTIKGFNCWNKTESLVKHVGEINSHHNRALKSCEDLVNPKQNIEMAFHKQDDVVRRANRIRLNATVSACRFCLKCALPFRGHDERETFLFKGNFLETMDLILSQNEELRNLPKAAGNNQYKAPSIQKDIATCFELEIFKSIFQEIGDDVFSLLVDESSDVSQKEQMAIVLRYVDAYGLVKERFVELIHVKETTSLFLKDAIDTFFAQHKLSLGRLKGQGYDGASNMRGEFNGLKARILEVNKSAYYVHCITNILSQALQRKNQDIVEAASLVTSTKEKLQELRSNGFVLILEKVSTFCGEYGIPLLDMEETCVNSRRKRGNITNRQHYEVDCFKTIMDKVIIEFCDRFSEVNTELLENMIALSPCKSFSKFDISKLMSLSELYPYDFDSVERRTLEHELNFYHHNVRKDERFANLNGITDLARVMVETNKHKSYPLVYRLLKLALILPVATATVERCFSSMKLVKSDLRNRIGDEFLNACLTCTIEKEALANVKNENVIARFNKVHRKGKLIPAGLLENSCWFIASSCCRIIVVFLLNYGCYSPVFGAELQQFLVQNFSSFWCRIAAVFGADLWPISSCNWCRIVVELMLFFIKGIAICSFI